MNHSEVDTIGQAGAVSAGDVREVLAQLRRRSPQEVIGLVSSGSLVQSTLLALMATGILIAVMTVVPYALRGPRKSAAQMASAGGTPAADRAAAESAAAEKPESSTVSGETSTGSAEIADTVSKAAKVLGIDETKTADPSINPLEARLDKLLDQ
jgi:hypothetical protein